MSENTAKAPAAEVAAVSREYFGRIWRETEPGTLAYDTADEALTRLAALGYE